MVSRIIGWIGRHAGGAVLLLVLAAGGNVLLQAWMHKTTSLTAWKGGGFGMYTEPHPDYRSVVMFIDDVPIQIWPMSDAMADWQKQVGPKGQAALSSFVSQAGTLRFYPEPKSADALLARAARIRWAAIVVGDLTPVSGNTFDRKRLGLQISEQAFSLHGTLDRHLVFCLGAGCGDA